MKTGRVFNRAIRKAKLVEVQIVLPCGKPFAVSLYHTGLGSHIAVITRKILGHDCIICKHLPPWELHIFKHMTPSIYDRYAGAIKLTDPDEEGSCP